MHRHKDQGDAWRISLLKDNEEVQTIEGLLATFCIDVSAEFGIHR